MGLIVILELNLVFGQSAHHPETEFIFSYINFWVMRDVCSGRNRNKGHFGSVFQNHFAHPSATEYFIIQSYFIVSTGIIHNENKKF